MKKIYIKGIIFCGIMFVLCAVFLVLSTKDDYKLTIAKWTNSVDFMDANEYYETFEKARKEDDVKVLLIGDSICSQMFLDLQEYNPNVNILSANAALMITGQYLLLEEYLESHPETTDVFLVIHPLALIRTFDMEWGYRNAVMTYVGTDTIQNLDDNTLEIIKETYGSFFLQKEVVWFVENSPMCRKIALSYLNLNKEAYEQEKSFELAEQYVKKMYELCEANGVTLHLYASPASEYYREKLEELDAEYKETWLYEQFPDYFANMTYYPSEWAEDYSHFSGEYASREKLNEMIKRAYADTFFLEHMNLGEK